MKNTKTAGRTFEYIFIILLSLISVFPFYWMIAGATNKSSDVITGKLTIGTYLFENCIPPWNKRLCLELFELRKF